MSGAALVAEMQLCLTKLRQEHADFLVSQGIDPVLLVAYQMVGVAHIAAGRQPGSWVSTGNGRLAFVVPVRVHESFSPLAADPWAAVRFGELVDLVAWCPKSPDRYWLYAGDAAWLGAVAPPHLDPFPVVVHPTPLAWLRAGAQGIALLARSPRVRCRLADSFKYGMTVCTAAQRGALIASLGPDGKHLSTRIGIKPKEK
jgi:hypothetical protein